MVLPGLRVFEEHCGHVRTCTLKHTPRQVGLIAYAARVFGVSQLRVTSAATCELHGAQLNLNSAYVLTLCDTSYLCCHSSEAELDAALTRAGNTVGLVAVSGHVDQQFVSGQVGYTCSCLGYGVF
jgi:hypothetical protein